MEESKNKHERKFSWRGKKETKSSTLPAGAVLMDEPGKGFFSKIRRSLRIRNKGKYSFRRADKVPSASDENLSPFHKKETDDSNRRKKSSKSSSARARETKSCALVTVETVSLCGTNSDNLASISGTVNEQLNACPDTVKSTGEQEASVGADTGDSTDSRDIENEVFESLDPDYETLDNIRNKIKAQFAACETSTTPDDKVDSKTSACAIPSLLVKVSHSNDRNEPDSGLGSPFHESCQDSQVQNLSSTAFDTLALTSSGFKLNKESISGDKDKPVEMSVGVSCPQASDTDPMVISATSSLGYASSAQEEDVYSNAKILISKQHQKESKSSASPHIVGERSDQWGADWPDRAPHTSPTATDVLAAEETESPDMDTPPPLPARNYSIEDDPSLLSNIKSHGKNVCEDSSVTVPLECHISQNNADLDEDWTCGELKSNESSDILYEGKGARPKCTLSVCIEQGPFVSFTPVKDNLQGSVRCGELSHVQKSVLGIECMSPSSTTSISAVAPVRLDPERLKTPFSKETEHLPDDDIPFIDEDPPCGNETVSNDHSYLEEFSIMGGCTSSAGGVAVDGLETHTEGMVLAEDVGELPSPAEASGTSAELSKVQSVEAKKNAEHHSAQLVPELNNQHPCYSTVKREVEHNCKSEELSDHQKQGRTAPTACNDSGLSNHFSHRDTSKFHLEQNIKSKGDILDQQVADDSASASSKCSTPTSPSSTSFTPPLSPASPTERDNKQDHAEGNDPSAPARLQRPKKARRHKHRHSVDKKTSDEPPPLPARGPCQLREKASSSAREKRSAVLSEEVTLRPNRNPDQAESGKSRRHTSKLHHTDCITLIMNGESVS